MLDKIESPNDVRKLSEHQLPSLCSEIRDFIINTISQTGGHLGASLGVVELTVALHWMFNTPYDKLIWDIGHQSYPHKILTGRKNLLSTLRQNDGISGFCMRSESKYDHFGAGHSSTSISAALGMMLDSQGDVVIPIIGDSAMTAGMAYEALNNASDVAQKTSKKLPSF